MRKVMTSVSGRDRNILWKISCRSRSAQWSLKIRKNKFGIPKSSGILKAMIFTGYNGQFYPRAACNTFGFPISKVEISPEHTRP